MNHISPVCMNSPFRSPPFSTSFLTEVDQKVISVSSLLQCEKPKADELGMTQQDPSEKLVNREISQFPQKISWSEKIKLSRDLSRDDSDLFKNGSVPVEVRPIASISYYSKPQAHIDPLSIGVEPFSQSVSPPKSDFKIRKEGVVTKRIRPGDFHMHSLPENEGYSRKSSAPLARKHPTNAELS